MWKINWIIWIWIVNFKSKLRIVQWETRLAHFVSVKNWNRKQGNFKVSDLWLFFGIPEIIFPTLTALAAAQKQIQDLQAAIERLEQQQQHQFQAQNERQASQPHGQRGGEADNDDDEFHDATEFQEPGVEPENQDDNVGDQEHAVDAQEDDDNAGKCMGVK